MPELKKLLEDRAKLATTIQEFRDKLAEEDRGFEAEERANWDKLNADYDRLGEQIEVEQRVGSILGQMQAPLDTLPTDDTDDHGAPPPPPSADDGEPPKWFTSQIYQRWLAGIEQPHQHDAEYRSYFGHRMTPEYHGAFSHFLREGFGGLGPEEKRALQLDLDTSGGFLQASERFVAQLIKAVDNLVFIRQMAQVFPVMSANSLGAPSLDNDPADATWTGEILTGSEDSTMSFGKRELTPKPLAKRIKVSRPFLRRSVIPAEQLVRDRLAYKQAVVVENAYLNGTGEDQPLGVFVASASGVSTSSDQNVGSTSDVTADGFIKTAYKLKAPYLANATWCLHRDVVRNARLLKDGEGRYIWQSGLATNRPDTIVDRPYIMSEYAPNTFSSAAYIGILGDWSYYWIADSLMVEIQRLDELYAATNQVGFIVRSETDGMPVLAEAFARMKLSV